MFPLSGKDVLIWMGFSLTCTCSLCGGLCCPCRVLAGADDCSLTVKAARMVEVVNAGDHNIDAMLGG